jgi:RHS repeat-associated protein
MNTLQRACSPISIFGLHRALIRNALGLVVALGITSYAAADTTSFNELSNAVRAPNAVAKIGTDLFGDQVNLYSGRLEFVQTDVTLHGNNLLPVSVGRRLVAGERGQGQRHFGRWDLEIPHLHGTFSYKNGWNAPDFVTDTGSRCSNFGPPSSTLGTRGRGSWKPDEFWGGSFLYVPNSGDQRMLQRSTSNTLAPGVVTNYPVVTAQGWSFSCLSTLRNAPAAGEGFIAYAPDGTQYQFDQMVSFPAPGLVKTDGGLVRLEVWIMPSKVTDRFGNTVTYTYDATNQTRVTSISSSDGRTLTLSYGSPITGNGNAITSVTDGTRTWSYTYHGSFDTASLESVILPDASKWQFTNTDALLDDVLNPGGSTCEMPMINTYQLVGSMTHPSGATGRFTLTPTIHGRSDVQQYCMVSSDGESPMWAKYFYSESLTEKTVTGPALASLTWKYSYSDALGDASWSPCNGCRTIKTISVLDPSNKVTLYTFGNQYNVSEGKLQQVDTDWNGSTALRTATTHYRAPGAGPYPNYAGTAGGRSVGDADLAARYMPVDQTTVTQQGVTFTWQANSWASTVSYPRATSITRFNSMGPSRTETTVYSDNFSKYVIGQIGSVTEPSTGQVMVANEYDGVTANLLSNTTFGNVNQRLAYYADGTVYTRKDGKGNTTTYSNYRAGLPQNTSYADGSSVSAEVTPIGYINWTTDEVGAQTRYRYDPIGRLNLIIYPSPDTVAWNSTSILVEQIPAAELGIAAGHWRQTVSTGNARSISYFDGLLRPILTRTYDANSLNTTGKAVRRDYDFQDNTTFQSYPLRDIGDVTAPAVGVTTEYDALSRATRVSQASDTSTLVTQYQFNSPFQKTIINPNGNAATTSFFALDTPSQSTPSLIVLPSNISVTIARDVFAKPTSITRTDGIKSATRSYVYDGNQRLCKTIEPETGATVQDYDLSNNIAWRATGLNLPATTCDTGSVPAATKMSFGYDARNRLRTTTYSDGSASIARTYTLDGLPNTISSNGSVWTNTYNNRRLNERESLAYGGITYNIDRHYDANASLSSLTYPIDNLTLNYSPNALGEPTQVGGYASAISYYPNGAVASFAYGNGIAHSMSQNARGLPSQSTDTGVLNDSYTYDRNGNVVSITDLQAGMNTRTMSYDNLDRLSSVSAPNIWGTSTYGYDGLDNITSNTVTGGGKARSMVFNYPDPSTNRLMSASGTAGYNFSYAYDSQGNIIQRGAQQYTFDQGNRLTSAAGLATYGYDGLGHRFTVVGTDGVNRVQVYSQEGQLLYVAPTSGAGTKYVYMHNHVVAEVTNSVPTYDHTDGLGSPVAQSDASRSVGIPTRYEPYGLIATGTPRKIGFTGHVNDTETGLIYMQQRYYDPVAGRFLSIDPVTTDEETGEDFNRYGYANNNPSRNIDPDGRLAVLAVDFIPIVLITGSRPKQDPFSFPVLASANNSAGYKVWKALFGSNTSSPPPPLPPNEEKKKTEFSSNGKHHPNSKNPEPKNAKDLFEKARIDGKGVRWAVDENGNIHRFSADSNGFSHWNGSTADAVPIREESIPIEIRREFWR